MPNVNTLEQEHVAAIPPHDINFVEIGRGDP
ncbi:unnamed protein product, partial [Allacma fusca]